MTITMKIGALAAAYIECALWASTDDHGNPLDDNYNVNDLAPCALATMLAECDRFERENAKDINGDLERAGHDFWLTRNGHGAGFWDGDWPPEEGARLTEAAQSFRECDLYVGDDGRLYVL